MRHRFYSDLPHRGSEVSNLRGHTIEERLGYWLTPVRNSPALLVLNKLHGTGDFDQFGFNTDKIDDIPSSIAATARYHPRPRNSPHLGKGDRGGPARRVIRAEALTAKASFEVT